MEAEHSSIPESTNDCCTLWKKKHLKIMEGRNALRQAVKLLEQKANELEAENENLKKLYKEEQERRKAEKTEKLKESNAKVSLENEVSALDSEIKVSRQECGANAEKENEDVIVKGLQDCISEKENEINRLKKLFEQENIKADTEKDKINAAYAKKLLEAEKKVEDVKALQACISEKEREISRLNQLLERETITANTERKIGEKEKRNAAELHKLLEAEKKKSVEKEMQLSKEVSEAKKKLASETMKFRDTSKRFAGEKQKLLVEKRISESATTVAQKSLEIEKEKAAKEKKQADIKVVKLKEQKKLLEDNLKTAMEKERLVDQMSQKLEEKTQTIEGLKQKLDELSSRKKSMEKSGVSSDVCVNAESDKVRFLEERLKLEISRVKHEKKKYKLKATCCSILQHELGRLKLDFNQIFQRLNALDTLSSPDPESMHGITMSQHMPNIQNLNAVTQVCNPNISEMYKQIENELMKACSTSMDACDPLRENMQHTPLLASSGVNITTSNSNTASFSNGKLTGSQEEGGALQVIASSKFAMENINVRPSMFNPSDSLVIEHNRKRKRTIDKVGNGHLMKMLYLHKPADEEVYRGSLNVPMPSSLHVPKMVDVDNLNCLLEGGSTL
ncbi:hypothetical protein TanjilG_31810 [Lupinus angustifolius]|uniref:Uncharacterized protein n=1 Tax=Lupinus angustifolius TaxID=3871 RepID=A0A4P1RMB0_LUPAN|nr:PREDICTED: coiled-coil domain-containing protein 18-like [Lupinus angustifolius]OIW13921.1 hypothetical protein TanjilG_31810 [Lupinus angustifolius]